MGDQSTEDAAGYAHRVVNLDVKVAVASSAWMILGAHLAVRIARMSDAAMSREGPGQA